jgi:nucleotide-binding universal stress UspA family protein
MRYVLHPDEYAVVLLVGLFVLGGVCTLLRLTLGGARQLGQAVLPPKVYRRILVPTAADMPIGIEAVQLACRLAGNGGSSPAAAKNAPPAAAVVLAYVIEVPRAFALSAALPDEEAAANDALAVAADAVRACGLQPVSVVRKGRGLLDETLRATGDEKADLLVLTTDGETMNAVASFSPSSGEDDTTQTEESFTAQIARRAPCEVILARAATTGPGGSR